MKLPHDQLKQINASLASKDLVVAKGEVTLLITTRQPPWQSTMQVTFLVI